MAGGIQVVTRICIAACLISLALADDGVATFYTAPYVPSACNGNQDDGVMIAAASKELWDNRGACGRTYQVTCTGATNKGVPQPCTGASVVVKIVDYCPPPGCQATIDLSQEAFQLIADLDAGKIQIQFNQL